MCGCCDDTNEQRCHGTPPRQKRVGQSCLEASICTGERPRGPRGLGKCQCAAEASWERCSPPRPRRDWASNFNELRRRWSEHVKRQNCPCDDCRRKTIQPLEDCRQICPNKHFDTEDNDDEDHGYRSSRSNRGCSPSTRASRRHCSPETRSVRSSSSLVVKDCREEKLGSAYCLCQPRRRNCCCRPMRIDARSRPECDCEYTTRVECPCPPSERRFPRSTKCCVVAKSCVRSASPRDERCERDERKVECLELAPHKSKSKVSVKASNRSCCKQKFCSGTSPDRPDCCGDHDRAAGCRGDNSAGHQQRHRRQQRATWERTTTKGDERLTTDDRTCGAECNRAPIVYERGELLIIEDLPRVCDNENRREVTSRGSCKQSHRRSRTPPRNPIACNFHECICPTRKKSTSNCSTQVSRRKLGLAKIAPCDYTAERRKYSSKEIQVGGGRRVDACVGSSRERRKREDAVTGKSSKRLRRTMARNDLNDAGGGVERISKIDLRCRKYITSCANSKKHSKCPPTCKYYNASPRKAASDDHQRLLSKRKRHQKIGLI